MADDKYLPHIKQALVSAEWEVAPKAIAIQKSGYQFLIDLGAEKGVRR